MTDGSRAGLGKGSAAPADPFGMDVGAGACIAGHNLAEERLRAEAEMKKDEGEKTEVAAVQASDEKSSGPEVIIVNKKDNLNIIDEEDDDDIEE